MNSFSDDVRKILIDAGWHDKRNVTHALEISSEFTLFPRAREVLAEFGGLRFGSNGPGIECARLEAYINPSIANHTGPIIKKYENILNTRLFPLGGFGDSDGYLIIDEEGRIYALPIVSYKLVPLAPTFFEALEFLLLGKKLTPRQIEAIWLQPSASGSIPPYTVTYTKWCIPSFERKVASENRSESRDSTNI